MTTHVIERDAGGNKVKRALSQGELDAKLAANAPTSVDVNAERDRRVIAGATFTITGYANPVAVSGDTTTQTNLLALATAASARMAGGDTASLTPYRDEGNEIHHLTPPQVFELWSKGAAFVSAVYQASWALKDNAGGILADYREDVHWP